ncbi:MAG TPA: radical SAM protein [bacterium]|nr:radical SAM protein [bacterium]
MKNSVIDVGRLLQQRSVMRAVRIRFPDFSSFAAGTLNYLAYRLRLPVSYRMSKISVESCSLCNMTCPHCYVHKETAGSVEHARKVMSLELFATILGKLRPRTVDWLCFNCWGEPLMNRQLPEMIRLAADRGFKTMFYSNGLLLDEAMVSRLIDAGLRRLVVSMDGTGEVYEAIRATSYDALAARLHAAVRIRNERRANLTIELNCIRSARTIPVIPELLRQWSGVVDNVQFFTEMLTDGKRQEPCIHLWMGHVSIFADGQVNLCGFDYDGEFNLGHISEVDLATLWNSPKLREMRRKHARGIFPGLCGRCQP